MTAANGSMGADWQLSTKHPLTGLASKNELDHDLR
ncbi:MAG: hypothetical protein RL169_649 [Armatimonadota bacterium]